MLMSHKQGFASYHLFSSYVSQGICKQSGGDSRPKHEETGSNHWSVFLLHKMDTVSQFLTFWALIVA